VRSSNPSVSDWRMKKVHCRYCHGSCVKNGCRNGKQRYRCRNCRRGFQTEYSYRACSGGIKKMITSYVKEGCGIRSISRLLGISPTTTMRRILKIAGTLKPPSVQAFSHFEMDELSTYIGNKAQRNWIIYAMERKSRSVVNFCIGRRTRSTLKSVSDFLLGLFPTKIYTDRLNIYRSIIPFSLHDTRQYGTNHIERKNLDLRTHLKRLNRKTICYSKSFIMLSACLKIYFWSQ